MKKSLVAATAAVFAFSAPASAADADRQIGLIVSGVVDSWVGVQIIDDGFDDDTVFVNGGEGALSLPLGDNLSIQSDIKYEYNTNATEGPIFGDFVFGPRYSFQGAVHLSWRDPSRGLFGVFGGAGTNSFGSPGAAFNVSHNVAFVGGEAQLYLDNITLYAQGGYVDFDPDDGFNSDGLSDGVFARGVVRWFLDNDSRVQLEGTYLNPGFNFRSGDADIFSVGARYDFVLAGLPVVGDTALFVGYRGTFRNGCNNDNNLNSSTDVDDHTIRIGTSYSFSGDRLTLDRQGATLDTPDFNHSCFGGNF